MTANGCHRQSNFATRETNSIRAMEHSEILVKELIARETTKIILIYLKVAPILHNVTHNFI